MPEGHFDGVMADVELGEIVEKGQEFFRKLGENPHETGVMAVENVEFVSEDTPWPVDLPGNCGGIPLRGLHPDQIPLPEQPTGCSAVI